MRKTYLTDIFSYRMLAALQMFGRNKRGVRFANEFCE